MVEKNTRNYSYKTKISEESKRGLMTPVRPNISNQKTDMPTTMRKRFQYTNQDNTVVDASRQV